MNSKLQTKLLLIPLALVVAIIALLLQGTSLLAIIKFPVFLEVGESLGWNWLSLTGFAIMFLVGIIKSKKIMFPFNSKKVPIILCMAAFTLLFYYSMLDMFPRLFSVIAVYSFTGVNPLPFLSAYLYWATFVNLLPTNIIGFMMYAGFTYIYAWKHINAKYLVAVFIVTFIFNASTLAFFGDVNMRLLSETPRIISYYFMFVPGWIIWTFCYIKMWRTKE